MSYSIITRWSFAVSDQQWLWLSSQKSCPACDNFVHFIHPGFKSFQIYTSKYPRSPHQSIPIKFLFYHEENVFCQIRLAIIDKFLMMLQPPSWMWNRFLCSTPTSFLLSDLIAMAENLPQKTCLGKYNTEHNFLTKQISDNWLTKLMITFDCQVVCRNKILRLFV